MNFKNLCISIFATALLGIIAPVSAGDESAIEEPKAGESPADDQSTADQPAVKSGTVMATHVASNADELANKPEYREHL